MAELRIPEVWEIKFQEKTFYEACGPRDVLIFKSSESLQGPEVVRRREGQLTQEDKDRLSSQGISSEFWDDDDAQLMKARFCRDKKFNVVALEDGPNMTTSYVLEKIASLLKTTRMPGVFVAYFGPGRRNTGDWCFCDGYITFQDLLSLYEQHFTGRSFSIFSDCSYSGKWVDLVMEYLDKCKIPPCGHYSKASGKLISVLASCMPDEIPHSFYFAARAYGNDKNNGVLYTRNATYGYKIAEQQHGHRCENSEVICGGGGFDNPCPIPATRTWQHFKQAGRLTLCRSPTEWAFVLMVDDIPTLDACRLGEVSPLECGEIIKSGGGIDPPPEVKKWIDMEYPGNNCFDRS